MPRAPQQAELQHILSRHRRRLLLRARRRGSHPRRRLSAPQRRRTGYIPAAKHRWRRKLHRRPLVNRPRRFLGSRNRRWRHRRHRDDPSSQHPIRGHAPPFPVCRFQRRLRAAIPLDQLVLTPLASAFFSTARVSACSFRRWKSVKRAALGTAGRCRMSTCAVLAARASSRMNTTSTPKRNTPAPTRTRETPSPPRLVGAAGATAPLLGGDESMPLTPTRELTHQQSLEENATLLTARRVKVEDLGPRVSPNPRPHPPARPTQACSAL